MAMCSEHQDSHKKTSCKGQLDDGGREAGREEGKMTSQKMKSEKRNGMKRRHGDDISEDEFREER